MSFLHPRERTKPILLHRPGIVAYIVFALLITGMAWIYAEQVEDHFYDRDVYQCRLDNVPRAYLRARAEEISSESADSAIELFPILNCAATAGNDGEPIPLDAKTEELYIELVIGTRRLPLVKNGKIVFKDGKPVTQPLRQTGH